MVTYQRMTQNIPIDTMKEVSIHQENPNEPIKPLLDRNNPNDQMVSFENRDGVGFIKIYDTDVRGDLRDKFDRINMTKYGEGVKTFTEMIM